MRARHLLILLLLWPAAAEAQIAKMLCPGGGGCLGWDGNAYNITTGVLDVKDVGDPSWFRFGEDNVRLWLDFSPYNGVYDDGEPIIGGVGDVGCNPTNTAGDINCPGSLFVEKDLQVSGIPNIFEDTLYHFRTASGTTLASATPLGGAIPVPNSCYPMFGYLTLPITAAGSDPTGSCEHPLATDIVLTEACATFITGTAPSGHCILQLYEKGERTTPEIRATFDVGGTELDTVGEKKCVEINVDVDGPESLYLQADSVAGNCNAANNWPELEILVRGYRVIIP